MVDIAAILIPDLPFGLIVAPCTIRDGAGWTQDGGRMEAGWRQDGGRMEAGWRQDGGRMETRWRQDGDRSIHGLSAL